MSFNMNQFNYLSDFALNAEQTQSDRCYRRGFDRDPTAMRHKEAGRHWNLTTRLKKASAPDQFAISVSRNPRPMSTESIRSNRSSETVDP
jgi:hypothetical protein